MIIDFIHIYRYLIFTLKYCCVCGCVRVCVVSVPMLMLLMMNATRYTHTSYYDDDADDSPPPSSSSSRDLMLCALIER